MAGEGGPQPLPDRPPRPLLVHWLVDSLVVFAVIVVLGLFWGVSLLVLAAVALAAGALGASWTRRLEARGLDERARRRRDDAV